MEITEELSDKNSEQSLLNRIIWQLFTFHSLLLYYDLRAEKSL